MTLWRYTSLEKLLALLQTSKLHFSQLRSFQDPYEGSAPVAWQGTVIDVTHLPASATKSSELPGWEEVRLFPGDGEYLKDERLRCELYVSCWHSGQEQSAAMWSVYSRKNGIAIKTSSDLLVHALRGCQANVELAAVQYLEITPGLVCGSPWTLKRPSFQHEKEVRACIRDPDCKGPGLLVPVNVAALIAEVYVSPESEPWTEDVVRDVVAKYGLQKPVQRSDLYTLR